MYRLNGFWLWTTGPSAAIPKMVLGGVTISARIDGTIETSARISGTVEAVVRISGTVDTVEP